MYRLNRKINISLEWDGDEANFTEHFEEFLTNDFLATFSLDIEVKEKTLKSLDYDVPDYVEVIVSSIEISNLKVFNDNNKEVKLSKEQQEDLKMHIKESIEF